jgi:hypothetical protein
MKRLLLFLLIGACSSPSGSAPGRELPTLVGQPVDVAVQKLGPATSNETLMGQRIYVWSYSDPNAAFDSSTWFGGPSALASMPTVKTCSLRISVDAGGIIRRAEHQGGADICYPLLNKLQ